MPTLDLLQRIFSIAYDPEPTLRTFMEQAQTQTDANAEVTAAVLDVRESARMFGVPLARRGIQPVYLRIVNRSDRPVRLYLLAINPNYFTPLEAAAANHFSIFKRMTAFGLLGLIVLPLLALLIPFKVFAAYRANRRMDELFLASAFHLRPIPPGGVAEGFVFTPFDAGTKIVRICLHSAGKHAPRDAHRRQAAAATARAADAADDDEIGTVDRSAGQRFHVFDHRAGHHGRPSPSRLSRDLSGGFGRCRATCRRWPNGFWKCRRRPRTARARGTAIR